MNFMPSAPPGKVLKSDPVYDSVLPACSCNPHPGTVTIQTRLRCVSWGIWQGEVCVY